MTLNAAVAEGSEIAGFKSSNVFHCLGQASCSFPVGMNANSVSVHFSAWRVKQPFPESLSAMIVFATSYVAVGAGGAAVTSVDGSAWSGRDFPAARANALTEFNGGMYAAAVGGTVHRKLTDGMPWSSFSAGTTADLNGIAAGPTTLVAVGK